MDEFLDNFGRDLFPDDSESNNTETELSENEKREGIDSDEDPSVIEERLKEKLEQKKIEKHKVQNEFAENQQSKQEQTKFLKKILSMGYASFFIDGFQVKQLNDEYKHLSKNEKAKILENVIEALNMNLKAYSSPERHAKYLEMKERERITIEKLNPSPNKKHIFKSGRSALKLKYAESPEPPAYLIGQNG